MQLVENLQTEQSHVQSIESQWCFYKIHPELGPDYMSRAGLVSRAALVRAGPVVM